MRGYKFCLVKKYFDIGYSLTSYPKYAIAVFGVASLDVMMTMTIFFIYGISCFFIGWLWVKYGFFEAENEVSNRFNLFVKEMRRTIKKKRFK